MTLYLHCRVACIVFCSQFLVNNMKLHHTELCMQSLLIIITGVYGKYLFQEFYLPHFNYQHIRRVYMQIWVQTSRLCLKKTPTLYMYFIGKSQVHIPFIFCSQLSRILLRRSRGLCILKLLKIS